ncbi:hypothetical protein BDA96_06G262200 [Sorghum bicolor]|uniref:Uncharacterized protein n=2 Tax=Sorghum bicolor TaxID=4558 RepID=A0A921UDL4_SORBI|nr:hypothetical protein BDA96_06G262200 [Sorghum bicolor]OQU82437.1 hypothetical protein SORBI_3006G239500 [Sorghum bicolor]
MTQELDYYWSLGEDSGNGAESCMIYKVQHHIRDVERFSYEPCMISIGPYHHGAASLQVMEKEKWGYLDNVLKMNYELAKYVESGLRWFPKAIMESNRPKDFHHLLHLCHIYFRPSKNPEEEHSNQFGSGDDHSFLCFGRKYFRMRYHPEENGQDSSYQHKIDVHQSGEQLNRWRRVAQYLEAGIKFKKREYDKHDPHSLLDIQFSNGAIGIPCIIVDDYTGTLFRNLIAFEQTCPQFGDDFTAYIVFLSQLISMPEDVTLLAQREVIVHHLDSDERVSDLFTMLSKDVVFDFNVALVVLIRRLLMY